MKAPADPAELDQDALNLVLDRVEIIVKFRAYTGGPLLVMLLGKFRDDVRDAFGKELLLTAERGSQHLPLGELDLSDLDTLVDAASTLLDRFASFMDDPELPELLRVFRDVLKDEKAERATRREETEQDAKVS
jgi:hypothetical protein